MDGQAPLHLFPSYGWGERRADAAVHVAGVILALLASVWLLLLAPLRDVGARGPLALYALGTAGMLAASAAYNLATPGPRKEWLRRLDHALIFAAIAGAYTPLLLLRGPAGLGGALCVGVWLLAAAGAGLKLCAPRRYERLGLICYLGLGWIGLPAAPMLAGALAPETGWLILAGGLLYTVGAGVQLLVRLRYHNALWHFLVLAAAACQYAAMWREFATGGLFSTD